MVTTSFRPCSRTRDGPVLVVTMSAGSDGKEVTGHPIVCVCTHSVWMCGLVAGSFFHKSINIYMYMGFVPEINLFVYERVVQNAHLN